MSSTDRYGREYLQSSPQKRQEARTEAFQRRMEEDRFIRRILAGLVISILCLALAVWLGTVPLPDWIMGQ